MDKESYVVRIASWADLIVEATQSGVSKTEWCRQHDIPVRKFFYWQKRVREYLLDHPGQTISRSSNLEGSALPATAAQQSFYEMEIAAATAPKHESQTWFSHQPASPALMLRFEQFELYIGEGFSGKTLASVIKVLKDA